MFLGKPANNYKDLNKTSGWRLTNKYEDLRKKSGARLPQGREEDSFERSPNPCGRCNELAANMSICIVDSDIVSVRSTELWALAQHTRKFSLGPGRLGALVPLGFLGPGPNTAMPK